LLVIEIILLVIMALVSIFLNALAGALLAILFFIFSVVLYVSREVKND